ncbi:hypothetical protein DAPPUDRAFT_99982 [Daphnia pulex]|uniref:DUF4832 domain-containing protein n=1 Tax=Daphnia pulex TaxID=6669 RepID=E9G8Y2_DAPPU|nr:hypothetical protein DAPPUDRAFT_99982 [Daphnia pulex]|eukprot:EFX84195.1 hypothetical protein DAPPUDRAFT_99982 [Daphnia pulex]
MNAGFSFLILCLLAGKALSACDKGEAVSFTPSDDSAILENPERGFYHHIEIELPVSNLKNKTQEWESQFAGWNTKEGVSLVLVKFALKNFVKKNFDSSAGKDLDAMRAVFDTLRSLGMKAIVRYSYVQCEKADGSFIFQEDAKKEQLLDHIKQVAPILKKSLDVIYVLQAGFIGCWGEWYYTINYAVKISKDDYKPNASHKKDRVEIMKALLNAVPGRMVQMRTPVLKQAFDECGGKNIQPADAFSTSKMCSQIGIHNDCFLASERDGDTFKQDNEDAERQWLKKEGLYAAVGGESCEDPKKTSTDCKKTIEQLGEQRFSFLNLDYHKKKTAAKGSTFCASLNILNSGVAPLYNKRPVEVLLRNKQSSKTYGPYVQENIDPRKFAPGERKSIDLSVQLLPDVVPGKYDVILNLPDGSSTLKGKAKYRILFANGNNVQDKTNRYNVIGQLTVN